MNPTKTMTRDAETVPQEEVVEGLALDDDDVDSVDRDAIPRRNVQVDNKTHGTRMQTGRHEIGPVLPWTETLNDFFSRDNQRLESFTQALPCAKAPRALVAEHSLPFTRPDAEMDKTDAHNVSAGIAKSEARRHKREGKKIGKQVQLEKLKEREHSKGIEERVRGLKRSALRNARADGNEAFDDAVEDGSTRAEARWAAVCRDKKYGFGGHEKRDK
ncbi:hypothetical protein DFH94DRAFT_683572 [Russula ochroleuca]|uniref:Uncharacterized protein n=1 Tax=Russula ochroleuca TaxID=152965 RepID=A0A9P5JUP3_9AGAM|nr:hypothetical protein DFH94DRAFT_687100 [Russula ochroleuca]KAF8476611.1 hypothetical protein DFH94DRAFT_683572 [Russula ochroleuca]